MLDKAYNGCYNPHSEIHKGANSNPPCIMRFIIPEPVPPAGMVCGTLGNITEM